MRELILLTFVTLDGVMQGPGSEQEDTSGGFTQGGWARSCWDDVMEQVAQVAMAEPYDVLFGRYTYDIFAAHFPEAGESLEVRRLNEATKYVVTSADTPLSWKNSVRLGTDNVVDDVRRLKQESGRPLQVHGSWQLAQTLIENDLVDEYRLWTFPVMVGSGKRLFDTTGVVNNLTLVRSEPTASGAIMAVYRRP